MDVRMVVGLLVLAGLVGLLAGLVWTTRSWMAARRTAAADRRAGWAAIAREMPAGSRLTAVEPGSCTVVETGSGTPYSQETRGGR